MPGRFISYVYLCAPVTKLRPSTLAADVPATFHSAAGVSAALAGIVLVSFSPCVNCPKLALLLPDETLPSEIATDARSTLHFRAARSISISRAAAAALRICGHILGVV